MLWPGAAWGLSQRPVGGVETRLRPESGPRSTVRVSPWRIPRMITPRLPRTRGLSRCLVAVAVVIAVWVTTLGAGRVNMHAKPDALPALSVSTLAARYKANRRAIGGALKTARRIPDFTMARSLSRLLTPGRQFLSFDARGTGRTVEVL